MEGADALLGGLAGGDKHADSAPAPVMKRDQDSTDDFEHLDRERQEAGESLQNAARTSTRDFLDMERDVFSEPRAPSSENFADKFTDSESDAGESPLHRPIDPTPVLAPAPAAAPKLTPESNVESVFNPETILQPEVVLPPQPKVELPSQPMVEPLPQPKIELPPQPKVEPPPQPKAEPPSPPKVDSPSPVKADPPPQPKPAAAEPPRAPVAHVIEAEVIFCQMGLDAWFDPQRLHPEVESLIYWRNAARSGAALGAGLALLVALACCSVVSVLAYAALLALSAAVAFRVYKNVLQAVQKTNEGHPFKWLLEQDISVPAERAQSLAAGATAHLNAALAELRRLFLVEDLVDSLKFGVLLWCLTYVGACFNGITLIILGWIALFTLPKAYEMNKAQVDANLELARAKINEISAKVRAAVPLGRKNESDKDK